jgi:outer membrane receptor protein involved in Fe transport
MDQGFQPSKIAVAVSLVLLQAAGFAAAQSAPESKDAVKSAAEAAKQTAKKEEGDSLQLEKIVVTGTSTAVSKMKQSVSVSTLTSEAISQVGATNAAELLRSVPGVRSESSGGESNANLTVRGLPISAGGARYVQFQEDGLPVLQFGDIAFATPDTFLRVDSMVDSLEVIRGGSASTLATNAPGGIINFLTNTGEDKGGSLGVSSGLGYKQIRVDVNAGGRIGGDDSKTRFAIGGFFRQGESARNGGVTNEDGGQLRANITHEFKGGFVRVNLKHLNDQAPTYLPVPVRFNGSSISTIDGIDPRTASFYSPYWLTDNTLNYANGRTATNVNDGFTVKTDSIGFEGELNAGSIKLNNKFRHASNSGRFIGIFPGDDVAPARAGTRYLTGPNAGQAYTGNAFTAVVFNTALDDFDLTANDLRASTTFNFAKDNKLTLAGGLYHSKQNLGITWNFNQYYIEANGNKPALLTSAINGTAGFGGCCMNFMDANYKTTSPYFSLAYEIGPMNLDASVRRDSQKAAGFYNQTFFVGANSGIRYDYSQAKAINYKKNRTSYSFGGNYRVTNDIGAFLRYSDGSAFNADRITFFNNPDLVNGKTSPGSIPINTVKQTEAGIKLRSGGASAFITLFKAKTAESNFDVTTQKSSANTYDAKGVELEAAYRVGGFKMSGGFTWTDAEIVASNNAALIGTTPKRQARVVYQLAPSFTTDKFTFGGAVVGTTKSKDDGPAGPLTITLPAFAVINAFATYNFYETAALTLSVNNLTDKIGYTESNDGRAAARSVDGRTVKLALKYTF